MSRRMRAAVVAIFAAASLAVAFDAGYRLSPWIHVHKHATNESWLDDKITATSDWLGKGDVGSIECPACSFWTIAATDSGTVMRVEHWSDGRHTFAVKRAER